MSDVIRGRDGILRRIEPTDEVRMVEINTTLNGGPVPRSSAWDDHLTIVGNVILGGAIVLAVIVGIAQIIIAVTNA